LKNFLQSVFNRRALPFILCILGILVVFISVSSMGGDSSKSISPKDTAFAEQSRILVGIVPDNGPFCSVDSNGKVSGYECELLQTIFADLYPGIPVEFRIIDSQMASYELKHSNIDVAIGMFPKDITKTQGLSLTVPYYTDGLYAYVSQSSQDAILASLQGHTVYLLSTEYPTALATKAFADLGIELETVSCSSYPDAIESLNSNRAGAIVGAHYRMESKGLDLQRIDQRIADISYRILLWKDNSDITALLNNKLNEMLDDGSLDALREKYELGNTAE